MARRALGADGLARVRERPRGADRIRGQALGRLRAGSPDRGRRPRRRPRPSNPRRPRARHVRPGLLREPARPALALRPLPDPARPRARRARRPPPRARAGDTADARRAAHVRREGRTRPDDDRRTGRRRALGGPAAPGGRIPRRRPVDAGLPVLPRARAEAAEARPAARPEPKRVAAPRPRRPLRHRHRRRRGPRPRCREPLSARGALLREPEARPARLLDPTARRRWRALVGYLPAETTNPLICRELVASAQSGTPRGHHQGNEKATRRWPIRVVWRPRTALEDRLLSVRECPLRRGDPGPEPTLCGALCDCCCRSTIRRAGANTDEEVTTIGVHRGTVGH